VNSHRAYWQRAYPPPQAARGVAMAGGGRRRPGARNTTRFFLHTCPALALAPRASALPATTGTGAYRRPPPAFRLISTCAFAHYPILPPAPRLYARRQHLQIARHGMPCDIRCLTASYVCYRRIFVCNAENAGGAQQHRQPPPARWTRLSWRWSRWDLRHAVFFSLYIYLPLLPTCLSLYGVEGPRALAGGVLPVPWAATPWALGHDAGRHGSWRRLCALQQNRQQPYANRTCRAWVALGNSLTRACRRRGASTMAARRQHLIRALSTDGQTWHAGLPG